MASRGECVLLILREGVEFGTGVYMGAKQPGGLKTLIYYDRQ